MIQRTQTIYLLLTFALSLMMFFVLFAKFIGDLEAFTITAWGIQELSDTKLYIVPSIYMGILISVATLITLLNIFLFKKRLIQIRLCMIQIVLYVGIQIYICYYIIRSYNTISNLANHSMVLSIADIIPLACIVLSYLAFKGVARDEALIRSLDRIR